MSDLFADDKQLFDDNAAQIAQLWGEIAEIDSEIAPLTSRRDAIREQIKELVTALGGSVSVPGFGTALMTKSSKSASYDTQTIDGIIQTIIQMVLQAQQNGEIGTAHELNRIVQSIADARKESTRAGYIMLKKDK
jgi:hypothetical protein